MKEIIGASCVCVPIGVLFLATPVCCASTIVGGFITEDTRWSIDGSPFLAKSSVLVANGATLTIAPGVEVRFDPGRGLAIGEGQLIARGTEQERIQFIPDLPGEENRWGDISFADAAIDASFDEFGNYEKGSVIEHAVIKGAGRATIPAVNLDRASPLISSAIIEQNAGTGLEAHRLQSFHLLDSEISENLFGGVLIESSTSTVVSGNLVGNNLGRFGGIWLAGNRSDLLHDNIVVGNSGWGVQILSSENMKVSDNVIAENDIGLEILRSSDVHLSANVIEANRKGVDVFSSRAITFSSDRIIDNVVEGIRFGHLIDNIVMSSDPANPTEISGNNTLQIINESDTQSLGTNPLAAGNVDARHVYWGTSDSSAVEAGISDFFDDSSKGIVFFEPFATFNPLALQPGDSNADFEFNQLDIVEVLAAGKYLTGQPASFSEGDWNGDGRFDQSDLVSALQTGNYLQGPYLAVDTPEPSSWLLMSLSVMYALRWTRRSAFNAGSGF